MEPIYYMEYIESKKVIEEMFDAYYKFKNLTTWKMFQVQDVKTKAIDKGAERYADIKKISKKDRLVKVEFYEDHFFCLTGDVKQEYTYEEIEGIYETATTLVFVAGKKRKKEAFLALKKGSVKGKSLADLKEFALKHCTKVKKGVVYLQLRTGGKDGI